MSLPFPAPLGTRALCLNSGRGPTAILAVRRAVAHAVDKAALVKGVFLDVEKPTLFAGLLRPQAAALFL